MAIYSFRGGMPDYCVPNVYCAPHRIILMRRLATAEAAVLPAKTSQMYVAQFNAHYLMRLATAEAAVLPAKTSQMCIAHLAAHFLLRRTAAEGSGPPSYFSRNTMARVSYSRLFIAISKTRILHLYVVILLCG